MNGTGLAEIVEAIRERLAELEERIAALEKALPQLGGM